MQSPVLLKPGAYHYVDPIGAPPEHVHDLRHTVGMRLREAGVPDSTMSDILWHSTPSMTHHYSVAQIVELHAALEKIKAESGTWNKSLQTLRLEHEAARGEVSPPNIPQRKTA